MVAATGGTFVKTLALAVGTTFCVPVSAELFLRLWGEKGIGSRGGAGNICGEELGVCVYPRERVRRRLMLAEMCDSVKDDALPWEALRSPCGKFANVKEDGGSNSCVVSIVK